MPDHSQRKLLVVIASFGTNQDKYMERLVQEYRAMPYAVHVVVVSNVNKPVPEGVELVVGLPTKDPWSLPFAHKKVMADRVNDFDLFIYSENDTLVTERNIEAFLRVSKELPATEIPGFLRYEDGPTGLRNCISAHGHYHWDPSSPCKRGPYTFAFLTNEHAACYLLTRKQLQQALASGGFLVAPYQGKYDLACTAATDPYTRCGFRKLICISHLDDFLLHHLPDKYTGPEFNESDQEFKKQIKVLSAIAESGKQSISLIPTETNLPAALYSKDYYEPVREEVLKEIPASVKTVLSLGSGSGKTEKWLLEHGRRVTAIPLDAVIGACIENTGVEVVHGDFLAAKSELNDRAFDCLFVSNVLHLAAHPEETLKSMAELLRPGGYILIVTPNVTNLKNTIYRLSKKPGYQALASYEQGGVHCISRSSIQKMLRAAGCRIERLIWKSARRFEKISSLPLPWSASMLSSEIIVLAQKVDGRGK